MERLKERIDVTKKALLAFDDVLNHPYSTIVRDAAIQRFEFTLEAIWKLAQRHLILHEGLESASPKSVIRDCFQAKLIDENQTHVLLQAVDDRNLTVHTYNEKLAEQIYQNLFTYQPIFHKIYTAICINQLSGESS